MQVHVFAIPNNQEHGDKVANVRRALLDALARYHAQEAYGATYGRDLYGAIGEAYLTVVGGPWGCYMTIAIEDQFEVKGGCMNFKFSSTDFTPLEGNEEPQTPGWDDSKCFGVVGYIGINVRGDLVMQLHELSSPSDDDEPVPSWDADISPAGNILAQVRLLQNDAGVFYGVIER